MTKVAIVYREEIPGLPSKYTEEEFQIVLDMVDESFNLLGGIDKYIKPDETVVLKPNCCTYFGSVKVDKKTGEECIDLQGAANTDARVLAAITKLALEKANAKEVITGETCAFDYHDRWQACITLDISGVETAVESMGGKVVDFNNMERVEIEIKKPANAMAKIHIPEILTRDDVAFINCPAMKTHSFETVTLGMKNYQGIFKWEDKMIAHDGKLSLKFVDIARTLPPRLTVISGIWAVQGQGPIPMRGHDYMTITDMNTIIVGDNVVATDAICAKVMGFDPKEIRTIRLGAHLGAGPMELDKIELLGSPIENVKREFIKPSNECNGIYKGVRILEGCPCYVCKALTRAICDGLAFTFPKFEKNKEEPIFILGKNAFIPDDIKDSDKEVFVIGDCAKEHKNLTSNTHFFPGCTPMQANLEIPGMIIKKWKTLE